MDNIYSFDQIKLLKTKLQDKSQTIVLVGGVFDLLHIGHIQFLKNAKKPGSQLIILLESDSSVKKKKGNNRPINTQVDRAIVLASLSVVDYVILLPEPTTDADYLNVTKLIKPAIIATTAGDPSISQKKMVAEIVGAKVVEVINQIEDKSTSHLAKLLAKDL